MTELSFPSRRTAEARAADEELVRVLDEMVQGEAPITARAVARRMTPVSHASTLTRDSWRTAKIADAEERRVQALTTAGRDIPLSTASLNVEALDIASIRSFVKVVRAAHLGRAAVDLGISQPGLSRRLQALEHQYGVQLLVRHGKGVAPTVSGAILFERFETILGLATAPLRNQARPGQSKPVVISLPTEIAGLLGPYVVDHLGQLEPSPKILIREADELQVETWIRNGQVDVAVAGDPTPVAGLQCAPVGTAEIGIIATPASDLAESLAPISVREVTKLPLILPEEGHAIRRRISQAAAAVGASLQPTCQVNSHQLMVALVRAGYGCGISIKAAVHDHLERGSLVFRPLHRPAMNVSYASVTAEPASSLALTIASALATVFADAALSQMFLATATAAA